MGRVCYKTKEHAFGISEFLGVAGYQLLRIVNYRRDLGDSPMQVFNYILNGDAAAVKNQNQPRINHLYSFKREGKIEHRYLLLVNIYVHSMIK